MPLTTEQEVKYHTRSREHILIQKKYNNIASRVDRKAKKETNSTCLSKSPYSLRSRLRLRTEGVCLPTRARIRFNSERNACQSCSEDSERSSSVEQDDDGVIIIDEKSLYDNSSYKEEMSDVARRNEITHLSCFCGKFAMDHSSLHEHIVTEHPSTGIERCPECGLSEKVLCDLHLCRICNVYSDDLEAHLKLHYQDRTGSGALMECRICCKTFPTVHEVSLHERYAHDPHRPRLSWNNVCDYCGKEFPSQHLRDAHLVGHFEHILGGIWELVEQMQSQFTDQLMANQCPICFSVLGSRKSFKMHIIHRHLAKDPGSFIDILNRPSFADRFLRVKQVIQRLPPVNSSLLSVKAELKQESKD